MKTEEEIKKKLISEVLENLDDIFKNNEEIMNLFYDSEIHPELAAKLMANIYLIIEEKTRYTFLGESRDRSPTKRWKI